MPENPNTIYETAAKLSEDQETKIEFATLKTRDNFETYFTSDVTDIRAITYSDSPKTLLNILQDIGTDDINLEVVIGDNTIDYRKKLRGKQQLAEKLERLQRKNRLQIYLASLRGNEVHSKIYILQHKDGSRTSILGSPNLSEQGWGSTRQKNAIAVFKTDGNQPLDNVFDTWYDEHKRYADRFMEDLTNQIQEADKQEREEIVHAWVDGRTTSQDEETELEQELTERLDEAQVEKATIIGEFEDPDLTLAVSNNENQADQTITQSLNGFDDILTDLREETRSIDASINGKTLRASPGAISKYSKEKFGAPKMWFTNEDKLTLQTESTEQLKLTRKIPEDHNKIDQALEHLEQYFQTVDKFGRTDHPEAVKAQMWEAIIWFFWSPFINRYAAVYKNNGIDLDKYLPSLYVYGEPGSGKGTLTRYAFHLLSDGHVTEPKDGDNLNKTNLTRVRRVNSVFPVVFDDIDPNDLDIETYLNFRQKHWNGEVDIPALAFISNDNLPRSRIQHRAKILNFDIQFKDTHQTAKYVNDLTERSNPLFTWFSKMFSDRDVIMRSQDADTLAEARKVFKELYNQANRELPSYFPEEPAEKKYDIGKWMWEDAYKSNLVKFQRRNGNLIAKFNDSLSVYSSVRKYARTLPNKARATQDGNQIQIKTEEAVTDWFPFNINENKGLLSKFL
jgi:hypothetical protein